MRVVASQFDLLPVHCLNLNPEMGILCILPPHKDPTCDLPPSWSHSLLQFSEAEFPDGPFDGPDFHAKDEIESKGNQIFCLWSTHIDIHQGKFRKCINDLTLAME